MTPHSKKIKHTVYFYKGWLDIDMVKGHQSIAYEISKQRNEPLVNVGNILIDFQTYSNEVKLFYQEENEPLLQDDDVKDLNNLTIYGGSLSTWAEALLQTSNKVGDNKVPIKIKNETVKFSSYKLFEVDIKSFNNKIIAQNLPLIDLLKKEDDEIQDTYNRILSY